MATVLDGATGAPRWERQLRAALAPWRVATDRAGNLFVAVEQGFADGFAVVGLGATSGSARPKR